MKDKKRKKELFYKSPSIKCKFNLDFDKRISIE